MSNEMQDIIDQINAPFDDNPPPNNPRRNGRTEKCLINGKLVNVTIVDEEPPRSYHGGGPEQARERDDK